MKVKHMLLVIIGLTLIVLGEFLKTTPYAEGGGFVIGMGLGTFAGGLYYIYKIRQRNALQNRQQVSIQI